jgi:hypothetical protein
MMMATVMRYHADSHAVLHKLIQRVMTVYERTLLPDMIQAIRREMITAMRLARR